MGPFQSLYDKHAHFGKESMQVPGLASVSNFAGNLKGGFAFGYTGNAAHLNPTSGGFRGTPFNFTKKTLEDGSTVTAWNPQLSVGGLASAGYGAIGGAAIGAGLGAVASQFVPGGNMVAGAAVGAGVGAAGLMLAPVAVGAAAKGAVSVLEKTPDIFAGVGKATTKAFGAIGKAAGSVANYAANSLSFSPTELKTLGFGAKSRIASAADPLGRYSRAASNIVGKFVKHSPGSNPGTLLPNYKFTGLGVAALGAGSLIKGVKGAYNTLMNDKIGQRDGYISSVTPQIRLADNAGATGDLVFALNNNRRG